LCPISISIVYLLFTHQGVPVLSSPDQDSTDLEKCLKLLQLADEIFHTPKRASPAFSDSAERSALEHRLREAFNGGQLSLAADAEAVPTQAAPEPHHQAPMVLLYGAFGGRFDQQMAAIHAAYKHRRTFWKN
jgi:thiamine pyrophosphokinase